MKRLLIITVLTCSSFMQSQIFEEHDYSGANINTENLRLVNLRVSGFKYVTNNEFVISLYNLDHTLYKTIQIPSLCSGTPGIQVFAVSEDLFDTNPSTIEYLVIMPSDNYCKIVLVLDENGNVLLQKDGIINSNIHPYDQLMDPIVPTPNGVKLILRGCPPSNDHAYVFSLPGIWPCYNCSSPTLVPEVEKQSSVLKNYPNPSKSETTVEYKFPEGITRGELIFYDAIGNELKRFQVTNAFNSIRVSTNDLPAGVYHYQLQSDEKGGFMADRKMVVVK